MTTGIRDFWLGRLRLVTYDDSFQEAVSDPLVLSGGVAALGARTPKRYTFELPLHGTSTDSDPYAAGQRMRRQVRSMTENAQARAQGFYMYSFLDPEQNGWLMIGQGTIGYKDGGVTLSEYSLTLDEAYRVASARAYRPAKRFDWYDRRLSTTPRDFLGSRFSTDFANLTGGVYALSSSVSYLPPGVTDPTGLSRAMLATFPVFGREGSIVAVVGRTYGEVVNYEQAETQRHNNDVVIYDRQGQGDPVAPFTNLVINPGFEPPPEGVVTAPWVTTGYVPTTFGPVTSFAWTGSYSLSFSGTVPGGGPFVAGVESSARTTAAAMPVVGGQTYSCHAVASVTNAGVNGLAGNVVWLNAAGAVVSTSNFSAAVPGTGIRQLAGLVTAPATAAFAVLSFTDTTGTTGSAFAFLLDAVLFAASNTLLPYFDGSSPGCGWTGALNLSTSQGPWGWVNPVRNPSFEAGSANWSVAATAGSITGSSTVIVGDDPLPPGNSIDVTAQATAGGTAVAVQPVAGVADSMPVVPGETMLVEGWVKLVAALPAGASATVALLTQTAAAPGGFTYTTAATLQASAQVGKWYRLQGTVAVPAGAAWATMGWVVSGVPNNGVLHARFDCGVVTYASVIGPPPGSNPPGFPNTAYFDGNSRYCGWMGAAGSSQSVFWLNPEDSPGQEEAYGGEHPLTSGDVPVLTNGICRVRAVRGGNDGSGNPFFALALDSAPGPQYPGGGAWMELGRLLIGPTTTTQATWPMLGQVSVAEWTPERAVLRIPLTGLVPGGSVRRYDVYVSLQRGWSGPRVEIYDEPQANSGASITFSWVQNDTAGVLAASSRTDGTIGAVAISTVPGDQQIPSIAAGVYEPWVAVASLSRHIPVVYMLRERDVAADGWTVSAADTNGYGATRSRVTVTLGNAGGPGGYGSLQLAHGMPGYVNEAETIRNAGSGTTAQVADPGGIGTPVAATAATATTGGSLPTGTLYAYQIVAYNAAGTSTASAISNQVTTGAGGTNANTLTLTTLSGAIGYLVFRRTGGSGSAFLIGSTTTTSFVDTGQPQSASITTSSLGVQTASQSSSSGNFVTETRTTTGTTLTIVSTSPPQFRSDGTYGLWMRVRGFPGDTLNFSWTSPSSSSHVVAGGALSAGAVSIVPLTMQWQWVYVGEAASPSPGGINVQAWVTRASWSPAASNIAIDSAVWIPTQRSAAAAANPNFDGARDQAAQLLIDMRAVSEVVQR